MKRCIAIMTIILMIFSLAGCTKKINGKNTYKVNIANNTSRSTGKHSELLKIHGTTSAPDGYEIAAINSKNKNIAICQNKNMKNYVQVKNGKFIGYIDPLDRNTKAKKGNVLKYHFIAVENVKKLNAKDRSAIRKEYHSQSIKLNFDPITEFVQSNVQQSLGSGAIVSKKSKTVYAITPKKDSEFENNVSKAMYGDKIKWANIISKVNLLSKKLKTPSGKIALVLINPENHKKFLLVSIGGQTKVDSISQNTTNSDTSNVSNAKASNGNSDEDGDDFDLGVILGYLLAYDDEYNDSDDDSSYNEYDDNNDNSYNDNYYDDSSSEEDNEPDDSTSQQNSSNTQPQTSSPSMSPDY